MNNLESQEDKISVVIPLYNRYDIFFNTLQTVLKQTCQTIEIIIVHNGPDRIPDTLLGEFSDNRIRFFHLDESNANAARNYGIMQSTGKYIAMLDADDEWLENHLEDCLFTLKQTGADGVYGSLFRKRYPNINQGVFIARELRKDESMTDYLLSNVFGAQTSTLFTTAESSKDILWDSELINHQDYDFVIRFCKKYKMIPKKNPTTVYVVHDNSLSHEMDCYSLTKFGKNNREDMNPSLYIKYNLDIYRYAVHAHWSSKNIRYFKKETLRNKEHLSYQSYISIYNPKNIFQALSAKLQYLWHIGLIKIEF